MKTECIFDRVTASQLVGHSGLLLEEKDTDSEEIKQRNIQITSAYQSNNKRGVLVLLASSAFLPNLACTIVL